MISVNDVSVRFCEKPLFKDVNSIKLNADEIENRRTFRRKNMLTLGTCTLVKTNQ